MKPLVVRVHPIPSTGLAESKDDARALREGKIIPALEAGRTVTLDFSEVEFATQSYVHALISEAIRRHQDRSFDLLKFRGCTDEVREVVLTVFEYTLAAGDAARGGGQQ